MSLPSRENDKDDSRLDRREWAKQRNEKEKKKEILQRSAFATLIKVIMKFVWRHLRVLSPRLRPRSVYISARCILVNEP